MIMSHYDTIQGYKYANEVLDRRSVDALEVFVLGLREQDWRKDTAGVLLETAQKRMAEGVNPDYQKGVIARVMEAGK